MKKGLLAIGVAVMLLLWLRGVISCLPFEIVDPIGEEVPGEPLLVALEAYRGGGRYFLRYRSEDQIYYAAGDLHRDTLTQDGRAGEETGPPVVTPMTGEDADPWRELTRSMQPVPVLGIEEWSAFRDSALAGFLPTEENTGVSVSFDRLDYFFFYDSKRRFRARRLIDKPPEYEVVGNIDLAAHFDQWGPLLTRFLAARGVHSDEVLFSTGDLDRDSVPFVYISIPQRLVVLVLYNELPEDVAGVVPGSHVLQSLWHFVESHTYGVSMRPFSSIHSLLTLLSDTAVESGRKLLPDSPRKSPAPPTVDRPGMDLEEWERELDRRLDRPASLGTIDFLVDGEAFFTRLAGALTSAQETIAVRAYIFDNDDVAMKFAELLNRRSREGIEVRVLYDGLGSTMAWRAQPETLPEDHRHPRSIEAYLKKQSRVGVRSVKNIWLRGDHSKSIIIDDRLAFIGGMNIGREYRYEWHDLMMEISGPVVDAVMKDYDAAWARAGPFGDFGWLFSLRTHARNEDQPGYPLRLIYTRPGRHEIFTLQREAIRRSQRYIYIENAYFTDDVLLRELIDARHRGVDVRVIIPVRTDSGLITRNIALAANTLLENGVRVYIYPGFTHAKAAVFDGWASVGSANLDRLSLKLNREINVATSEPAAVNELLSELFEPDFRKSIEMTEPFPVRWSDHLIELVGDYTF